MAYINTPPVVTNGLILHLDAGNRLSYTSGSTVWNDLSGNNNSGSLTNGPTFNSANQGSIVFDGSNDRSLFASLDNGTFLDSPFFVIGRWTKPSLMSSLRIPSISPCLIAVSSANNIAQHT